MRIWGSQRSHFPRRRSFFCFSSFPSFWMHAIFLFPSSSIVRVQYTLAVPSRSHERTSGAWENLRSRKVSHVHGRIALAWENRMRIQGGQRSHLPRHRSFFCFRFFASFVSPSAIANSFLFRRSGLWIYAIFRQSSSGFNTFS